MEATPLMKPSGLTGLFRSCSELGVVVRGGVGELRPANFILFFFFFICVWNLLVEEMRRSSEFQVVKEV